MKEYFSHDYNTRTDEKIKKLIRKHGMLGYGVFWSIVEDLYNNANALQLDCEGIAFDMRVSIDIVESIIKEFDLFIINNDNTFSSASIEKRLIERENKSQKAKKAAAARWNKNDANAMQTHSERNAIKEKNIKEKESKLNNSKKEDNTASPNSNPHKQKKSIQDLENDFRDSLLIYRLEYGAELCEEFADYWTEPNQSKTKLKYQLEKTFSIERRLKTWYKRSKNYKNEQSSTTKNYQQERLETIKSLTYGLD